MTFGFSCLLRFPMRRISQWVNFAIPVQYSHLTHRNHSYYLLDTNSEIEWSRGSIILQTSHGAPVVQVPTIPESRVQDHPVAPCHTQTDETERLGEVLREVEPEMHSAITGSIGGCLLADPSERVHRQTG